MRVEGVRGAGDSPRLIRMNCSTFSRSSDTDEPAVQSLLFFAFLSALYLWNFFFLEDISEPS